MANDSSDLWPADIVVDVLSPIMILNEQAEALAKKTKGVVKGEVLPSMTGEFEQLSFDLVAPAAGIRQRILRVRFSHEMPYPVVLIAAPLHYRDDFGRPHADAAPSGEWKIPGAESFQTRLAHSPNEVRALLKTIFNAPATRATLFSLIARSNEMAGAASNGAKPVDASPSESVADRSE